MTVRKVSNGFARFSSKDDAPKCGMCPGRDRNGVCTLRAEYVSPACPCCRYGHMLMERGKTVSQPKGEHR